MKEEKNPVHIIMFSMHDNNMTVLYALKHGAHGFVSKAAKPEEIFSAIDCVMDHHVYADAKLLEILIDARIKMDSTASTIVFEEEELTLLSYIKQEFCTKEIASKMHKSTSAIDAMRSKLIHHSRKPEIKLRLCFCILHGVLVCYA